MISRIIRGGKNSMMLLEKNSVEIIGKNVVNYELSCNFNDILSHKNVNIKIIIIITINIMI